MDAEDIFEELKKLSEKKEILKIELYEIILKYAKIISVQDLMYASIKIIEEGKYIQSTYHDKFMKVYVKYFLMRIRDIKEKQNISTKEHVNKEKFDSSIELLYSQFKAELYQSKNDRFPLIYTLTSLYTTFILNEPIHPEGCPFPGNLKVEKRNGKYYCPVKEKQLNNESSVCRICIAKQKEEI